MDFIRTENAPAAIGPYSQAVSCNGFLFCSGQIALDSATGQMVGCDAASQAEQVLKNLGAVLEASGAGFRDVVKTTIFLSDMADFGVVNDAYAAVFGDHRPARATVAARGLPKGALVEIDAIARLD